MCTSLSAKAMYYLQKKSRKERVQVTSSEVVSASADFGFEILVFLWFEEIYLLKR